jgi:uncharacterized phage protein (predicted DNA packaging)
MLDLTLDELKNYLRVDGSEDDTFLALLIEGAKEYLANAGVPESDSKLYKLAVMLYVALQYENRDPSAKMEQFNFALQSIVLQLKQFGDAGATDTEVMG